ncbi:MAG TPA: Ig-like domain-containing protein [Caldimonas sp.]|nr:Ig-like domain-containing protein [Caldimonas sp.]
MQASTLSRPEARRARSAPRRLLAGALLLILAACGGNDDAAAPGAPSPSIAAVSVTAAADHVAVGQTARVTAEARDSDGAVMAGAAFTWTSSDTTVAAVVDGVVTGVAAGAARITASSGGVTSDPVTVAVVVVAKGSVVVDRASVFFTAAGQSRRLTALAADAQGATATAPVTWTSSAPTKVSVDASGNVTALAIGSAQITASAAGIDSAPTLIVVAEPQPGALLVSDAQVVSVGAPFLVAGALPTAAAQYEVTLQGVTAPLPGSVVLAAESAPIAGKVVATRQDAAGLIVTLAVAPLPQLFRAYDIDWTIRLSAFPALPAEAVPQSLGAAWSQARFAKMHPLASKRPLDTLSPFKPLDCDAGIAPQIGEKKATLALDNKLDLVVKDTVGYSRHSLEGTATITGSASLALKAGIGAKGRCDATAQIKLPVLGWVSVIVMPAVRFGLGARIGLEILLLQGEVGVEGDIVFSVTMGWECGGVSADCRSLDDASVQNHFTPKGRFPTEHDMQAKVSGQFYVLAGLDASLFMGLGNAKIVEARIGPTQSFNLAFENDQAARADYASSYDLKLEGVIEPGSALKKAIEAVIGDDSVELTFKAAFSKPLSDSPKGTLSVDKARVAIGAPIVFSVDFDANTVSYAVIGYNVTGVQLYRRRDDEVEFTAWKAMDMIASTKATYRWTPEAADAGNYEFAAFVNTEIQPLPWLEVAPGSVQKVEVSCFTAGVHALAPGRAQIQAASGKGVRPQATTCADTWVGTTTTGDLAYGPNQTEARLTLKVDDRVSGQGPGQVFYYAEGVLKVNRRVTDLNGVHCEWLPFEIVIDKNTGAPGQPGANQFSVDYAASPPTAGGAGGALGTQTIVCDGGYTTTITNTYSFMSAPQGELNADGLSWSASHQPFYSYQFTRP